MTIKELEKSLDIYHSTLNVPTLVQKEATKVRMFTMKHLDLLDIWEFDDIIKYLQNDEGHTTRIIGIIYGRLKREGKL